MRSSEFRVREAVEADLPVLVEFLAELALHVAGGPRRSLEAKERRRLTAGLSSMSQADDSLVVVAETRDEELVGMGTIAVVRSLDVWEQTSDVEYRSGFIDDIWVQPDRRGAGVFSAMLRELLAFAEAHGVQELILEYATSNEQAAAVWGRLGFEPRGVRVSAFTETVKAALDVRRGDGREEIE